MTKTKKRKELDIEKLLHLYVVEKLPVYEISCILGISYRRAKNNLEKYGFSIPKRKPDRDKFGRFVRKGQVLPPMIRDNHPHWKGGIRIYRDIAFEYHPNECYHCKDSEDLQVHHIDHNRENNNPSNLLIVCRSCHIEEHHPYIYNMPRDNKGRFISLKEYIKEEKEA